MRPKPQHRQQNIKLQRGYTARHRAPCRASCSKNSLCWVRSSGRGCAAKKRGAPVRRQLAKGCGLGGLEVWVGSGLDLAGEGEAVRECVCVFVRVAQRGAESDG